MTEQPRRLAGETYVFEVFEAETTNSGYVAGVLIDTGPDPSVYEGHPVMNLLITHGHADHFSSAAALRGAGARVATPREEAALVENPEVNIRGMFSWARPSDEMVTKLFRGEGCRVDAYADEWRGYGIDAVPLPGHTLGHTGYLTSDGVLFTGDAVYEMPIWARHRLPYAIDPGLVRSSLSVIERLDFEWMVPGHGVPSTATRPWSRSPTTASRWMSGLAGCTRSSASLSPPSRRSRRCPSAPD